MFFFDYWCVIYQIGCRCFWVGVVDKVEVGIKVNVVNELKGVVKVVFGFFGEIDDKIG